MKKILVIGDSCTDIFQYGTCERLSPEAAVPIFLPTHLTTSGGMAINVAENIKSLGIECDLITNDFRPAKTRYVEEQSNHLLLRIDVNDHINPIEWEMLDKINFNDYSAVIISDYNKGYIYEDHIDYISKKHDLVFLDSKKRIGNWVENIDFVKINKNEFLRNWDDSLRFTGDLIVTLGKDGADHHNKHKRFSIENEHEVRDLSGAGDTFIAALVVKYLENKSIDEAIDFANKCAAWVVTQKGVVAVDPRKL
jgi:D-beta-D-heptose 7-phosphate kinase/D-beta-D-heptose 1-phosphate adenosyltransferase